MSFQGSGWGLPAAAGSGGGGRVGGDASTGDVPSTIVRRCPLPDPATSRPSRPPTVAAPPFRGLPRLRPAPADLDGRRLVGAATGLVAVIPVAMAAGSAPPHRRAPVVDSYVALGDSYTSGPAVPPRLGPTTTPAAPSSCLRSSDNYPSLTARALGLALTDVSCAGATTGDLTGAQAAGVPAQLDALRPTTSIVSVGIGGNDLGFSRIVDGCISATPWGGTRVGWSCAGHDGGESTDPPTTVSSRWAAGSPPCWPTSGRGRLVRGCS